MNFPDQVKEIINNSRYWKNTNTLSEEYVNLIINAIIDQVDSTINFLDKFSQDISNEERLSIAYTIVALEDMKKVFRGKEEDD